MKITYIRNGNRLHNDSWHMNKWPINKILIIIINKWIATVHHPVQYSALQYTTVVQYITQTSFDIRLNILCYGTTNIYLTDFEKWISALETETLRTQSYFRDRDWGTPDCQDWDRDSDYIMNDFWDRNHSDWPLDFETESFTDPQGKVLMRLNALGLILNGLEQLVQVNSFGIHSVTRVRQKFAGKNCI